MLRAAVAKREAAGAARAVGMRLLHVAAAERGTAVDFGTFVEPNVAAALSTTLSRTVHACTTSLFSEALMAPCPRAASAPPPSRPPSEPPHCS